VQKSKLMRQVESANQKRGPRIEEWFPEMVRNMGLSETARVLSISKGTAQLWLLKMGYVSERRVTSMVEDAS
jgi:transposase-like protein